MSTKFIGGGIKELFSYLDSIPGRVNYCDITYLEKGYVVRTK